MKRGRWTLRFATYLAWRLFLHVGRVFGMRVFDRGCEGLRVAAAWSRDRNGGQP
jgi:hypothetical protein